MDTLSPNYLYWREHGAEWHAEYDLRKKSQVYYHSQQIMIAEYLRQCAPARVLEFGCGVGRHLRYLNAIPGLEVHGYDQSAGMVAGMQQWAAPEWLEARVRTGPPVGRLPYSDGEFDIVFTAEVLVHVRPEDLASILAELIRVARWQILHFESSWDFPLDPNAHNGCWYHDLFWAYGEKSLSCETLPAGYRVHRPYRVVLDPARSTPPVGIVLPMLLRRMETDLQGTLAGWAALGERLEKLAMGENSVSQIAEHRNDPAGLAQRHCNLLLERIRAEQDGKVRAEQAQAAALTELTAERTRREALYAEFVRERAKFTAEQSQRTVLSKSLPRNKTKRPHCLKTSPRNKTKRPHCAKTSPRNKTKRPHCAKTSPRNKTKRLHCLKTSSRNETKRPHCLKTSPRKRQSGRIVPRPRRRGRQSGGTGRGVGRGEEQKLGLAGRTELPAGAERADCGPKPDALRGDLTRLQSSLGHRALERLRRMPGFPLLRSTLRATLAMRRAIRNRGIPAPQAPPAVVPMASARPWQFVHADTALPVVAICHPRWQGMRSAAEGHTPNLLLTPQIAPSEIDPIVECLAGSGATHFICEGFFAGYADLLARLRTAVAQCPNLLRPPRILLSDDRLHGGAGRPAANAILAAGRGRRPHRLLQVGHGRRLGTSRIPRF